MAFLDRDFSSGIYRSKCTYCQNEGIVLDGKGNMYVCHRCHGSSEGFSRAVIRYFEGYRGFRVVE